MPRVVVQIPSPPSDYFRTDDSSDDGPQHSSGDEASRPDSDSSSPGLVPGWERILSDMSKESPVLYPSDAVSDLSNDSSSDDSPTDDTGPAIEIDRSRMLTPFVNPFTSASPGRPGSRDQIQRHLLEQHNKRRLLMARQEVDSLRSSENAKFKTSTVATTASSTKMMDEAGRVYLGFSDDEDVDDRYLPPMPRSHKSSTETRTSTVATTTSSTRMTDEPRIVFKHHTISEDLSREEKDKGAKLQYLNKKLGGRLELRNTRLR
ncbi:hypothetical protein FQN50_002989 [Emmonsiellopsis sp. PD_5]|nr:hypothetical protein FQN50_002989 [Emmonsiellopsis sp. PD_5]